MIPADFTPIQNPEILSEGVKDFSYTGLHRWFDQLENSYKRSDTYAVFQDVDELPPYSVHLHENTMGMGVSAFFRSSDPTKNEVHITAKQLPGNPKSNFEDIDIEPLPVDALRWKRHGMRQFDLVKLFIEGRDSQRPTLKVAQIALVRAGVNLSVEHAESAIYDIGQLITRTTTNSGENAS